MRLEKRYLTIVIIAIVLAVPVTLSLQHRTHQLKTIKAQNYHLQLQLNATKKSEQLKNSQIQQQEKLKTDLQQQNADLKNQLQAKKDEADRLATASANYGGYGSGSATSMSALAPANINSAGNFYAFGNCTWYVKNRRADIPNSWGNANAWLDNAQAMGWPTGSMPRAGAIGQTSAGGLGHVVYVESVSGGLVNISEMNFNGFDIIDSRTVPASDFMYIY